MKISNIWRKLVAEEEVGIKLKLRSIIREESSVGFIFESGDGSVVGMEVELIVVLGLS